MSNKKKSASVKKHKIKLFTPLKIFILLLSIGLLATFVYKIDNGQKQEVNVYDGKLANEYKQIIPILNPERYVFNNESKCRFYSIVLKDGSELVIEPNSQVLPDGEEDLGKILHLVNGKEEVLFEDFNLYGDTCTPLTLIETDDPSIIILTKETSIRMGDSTSNFYYIDLKNKKLLFTWVSNDVDGYKLINGDSEVKIGYRLGGEKDECYEIKGGNSELIDITVNNSNAGIIDTPLTLKCVANNVGKGDDEYYSQSEVLFDLPRYNPNTNSADITLNLVDFALSEDKQRVNRDIQASVNFSIDLNTLEVKKNKN